MVDWNASMYDPIYATLGVPAVLDAGATDGGTELTVIDKTAGVELFDSVQTLTVVPAAFVRMRELIAKGVNVDTLDETTLTFNDSVWLIKSHRPAPSPKGINDGELMLVLEQM